jgi:RNA recognition motif-containing protein
MRKRNHARGSSGNNNACFAWRFVIQGFQLSRKKPGDPGFIHAFSEDVSPGKRTRSGLSGGHKPKHMAARLFVGNLPFTTTENDLQDHFGQAGSVVAVNIMQDRATGRSRGFAFIEMASPDDATKAITMFHQKDFQGRALTVNEARPREERPPGGGGGGGGYRDRR